MCIGFSNGSPVFEEFVIDEPLVDQKFMAIAYDGCGNYLCMRKNGENVGKLYFLDHDTDYEQWDVEDIDSKKLQMPWCAFYKIHDAFDGIIAANYVDEDIEDYDANKSNEIWMWSDHEIVKSAENMRPGAAPLPEAKQPAVFSKFSKSQKVD